MQLNCYATLNAFRQRQGLASSDTGDDARMLAKLRAATTEIDRYTGRSFLPTIATRRFDWRGAKALLLRGFDLMELTTLTNGDGSTIDPSAIISLGGINGPIVGIELDITKALFVYQSTTTRAISVSGVWGWHDDYASAWKPAGEALSGGGMTMNATIVTVANVNGADGWGMSPRFSAGQLLKVDAEYMHIVATDAASSILTLVRGVNGSTAAVHSAGAAITIFAPPADIQEIALRWAGWLYKMEDSGDFVSPAGSSSAVMTSATVAAAIPPDLLATLVNLRHSGGAR